jgi:4-hydroxy-3-methylbut-2-en-1-yl diphosphate synthase IspG/GcpE
MRIKNQVLDLINTLPMRMRIGVALGKSEQQVKRYIDQNSDDLTKAAAMEVIRKFTGLGDNEILESNTVETKNA